MNFRQLCVLAVVLSLVESATDLLHDTVGDYDYYTWQIKSGAGAGGAKVADVDTGTYVAWRVGRFPYGEDYCGEKILMRAHHEDIACVKINLGGADDPHDWLTFVTTITISDTLDYHCKKKFGFELSCLKSNGDCDYTAECSLTHAIEGYEDTEPDVLQTFIFADCTDPICESNRKILTACRCGNKANDLCAVDKFCYKVSNAYSCRDEKYNCNAYDSSSACEAESAQTNDPEKPNGGECHWRPNDSGAGGECWERCLGTNNNELVESCYCLTNQLCLKDKYCYRTGRGRGTLGCHNSSHRRRT